MFVKAAPSPQNKAKAGNEEDGQDVLCEDLKDVVQNRLEIGKRSSLTSNNESTEETKFLAQNRDRFQRKGT